MNVWVTRTEPGAARLARRLAEAGYGVHVAPVLAIDTLTPVPIDGSGYALGIVLSGHALHAVPTHCAAYLAVGEATRQKLEALLGVKVQVPSEHSSEGVVRWLSEHPVPSVVLVTGRGGRGLIQQALQDMGAHHVVLEAYRRRLLAPEVKTAQIGAIEAASGDGVRQAATVWFAAGGDAGVPILVPSTRVGEIAADAGFGNVVICEGASPEDVLQALAATGLANDG